MNNRNKSDDAELSLEEYFVEARQAAPEPSDALMDRILVSAQDQAAASRRDGQAEQTGSPPPLITRIGEFWASLEIRLAASVLAASACAGFFVGFLNAQMPSEMVMAIIQSEDVFSLDFVAVPTIEDLFPEELS